MKRLCLIALMLTSLSALAEAPSDQALLEAEVEDAQTRQQRELRDRIDDLEAQQAASKAIAEKQQRLIQALEQQIQALQERERERSDPQE